jgi:hypothetical protein
MYFKEVAFLFLICFSCRRMPERLPDDFSVRLSFSAIQPGAPGGFILIKKSAHSNVFEYIEQHDGTTRSKFCDERKVDLLYKHVVGERLFKLPGEFADMEVLDGSTTEVEIVAHGTVKIIRLRNISPKELHGFFNLIREIGN